MEIPPEEEREEGPGKDQALVHELDRLVEVILEEGARMTT